MYHYHIYFITPEHPEARRSVHATNPVMALDHFHSRMQLTENKQPGDYTIVRLTQIYPGIRPNLQPSFANMVEAEIDLPHSANPDLRATTPNKDYEQTAFPFGVE
jgi:hypothetical protein